MSRSFFARSFHEIGHVTSVWKGRSVEGKECGGEGVWRGMGSVEGKIEVQFF
jgi:hypothetical protein